MNAAYSSRECKICVTTLTFDEPDALKGLLLVCIRCQDAFCQACFVEAHGKEEYGAMMGDDDRDIICPQCFTKS